MNFHMGLKMTGLHIGHHNVLEKALKYSGECLFSFLLFLPFPYPQGDFCILPLQILVQFTHEIFAWMGEATACHSI